MDESILLLAEEDENGNIELSTNCTFEQAHGLVINLIQLLADTANVPYNTMLKDFVEIDQSKI